MYLILLIEDLGILIGWIKLARNIFQPNEPELLVLVAGFNDVPITNMVEALLLVNALWIFDTVNERTIISKCALQLISLVHTN